MKKVIVFLLILVISCSTFNGFNITAQEGQTDVKLFDIDYNHTSTTEISGDSESGYRYTTSGEGRHRILYNPGMPITGFSVDFGHSYSGNFYGEFGISLNDNIDSTEKGYSDEQVLTFFIRPSNGELHVSLSCVDSVDRKIAILNDESRPSDTYWGANISNYSFVKIEGHWHLAIDGTPCNNVLENFEYSCLENILGDVFEKQIIVYPYFGGHSVGKGYFKPVSVLGDDGILASYAVDSYKFNLNGSLYEYRGQGLNYPADTRAQFEYSAIPSTPKKDGDGYVVDFTGTNGYVQTVYGYDLKTTEFYYSPITYSGNQNRISYEIGFTSNPTAPHHHNIKSEGTMEFRFISIYNENRTAGLVITNKNRNANPTTADIGRIPYWRTHRYSNDYKSSPIKIAFVEEVGADGELHWYMKTTVSGSSTVAKSNNVADDVYLQFDNIIDKPVYFRMGTNGKITDSFKMYCKIQRESKKQNDIYHNLALGDYKVDKSGFVLEGKSYDVGSTIDSVGSYYIEYIDGKNLYNCNLNLYKFGDVNIDNEIDIVDLVAIKKFAVGNRTLSVEGELSADFDSDKKVNSLDITELRKRILQYNIPNEKNYYIKDFGAVGDGITNDGVAVYNAVEALNTAKNNARLFFEENGVYYCKENNGDSNTVIRLVGCNDVHICGDNTKIITEAPMNFLRTKDTVDCSLNGISFTYGIRPYFMAQNATKIYKWLGTCVMEIGEGIAEKYLGLTEIGQTVEVKVNGNNGTAFGVLESKTGRHHMFINKYELVDKNKIKIYFNKNASEHTGEWMEKLDEQRLVCPTPNVGHMVEHAVSLKGDTNLKISNFNIYSACKFAVEVINAEGVIDFDNFNIVPDPSLEGTNEYTDFSAWRDGWHLKENRAKVIWKDCKATGLQDDILNISSSIMWVKEVISKNQINMYWDETGGAFRAKLKKGDEITIVNIDTGDIIASTKVSKLIRHSGSDNIIELEDAIENLPSGENIKVMFDSLVAPDSVIDNCWFDGTFRFRGPITISNTKFICKRMWIDVLKDNWLEGPIPQNILFKNCELLFEKDNATYVHATSYNNNVTDNSYHLKNVVFDNCLVNPACFEIGAGDEVVFKNCTTK